MIGVRVIAGAQVGVAGSGGVAEFRGSNRGREKKMVEKKMTWVESRSESTASANA